MRLQMSWRRGRLRWLCSVPAMVSWMVASKLVFWFCRTMAVRRTLVEQATPGSLSSTTSTTAWWHDEVVIGAVEVAGDLCDMVDARWLGSGRDDGVLGDWGFF